MATAEQYAEWIVNNADKKGTPEFETVAEAYKIARQGVQPKNDYAEATKAVLRSDPLLNTLGGALRGAGSIGATILELANKMPQSSPVPKVDEDRRAAMDDALSRLGLNPSSGFFQAGKLGGEIAGTAGVGSAIAGAAKALPMASRAATVIEAVRTSGMSAGGSSGANAILARMLGGGITGYASAGLVNPEDAEEGAAIGAVMPAAIQTAGKAGQFVGKAFRPSATNTELARKAVNDYGIPLGFSDVTDNSLVKGARSVLDDVPLVGRIGATRKEAVQQAFNREVGRTFGASENALTPEVMDRASGGIKRELNRIWDGNSLKLDADLMSDIARIEAKAAEKLNPEQAAQVSRQVQSLLGKAEDAAVNGGFANNWQSELRMVAESEKGLHKQLLSDLRAAVIKAFNRSVGGEDAAALTKARAQYKAFKTVEPLMQGVEAGVAGRKAGDVPAALLPNAVRQSYGSRIGSSPFKDLSQIGSQFVVDRVPRTGGSARAAIQNSTIGTGMTLATYADPTTALFGIPASAGLAATVEGLLSSPGIARYMLDDSASLLANPALYRSAPLLVGDR